jgi:hypothetical protein
MALESPTLGAFVQEPLQGKTSLAEVIWFYGGVGSVMRAYLIEGLVFSLYFTVATYQCAMNCRSRFLGRWVRASVVAAVSRDCLSHSGGNTHA